jgi:(2R)-sulfolactate sulfo-lyase subunit alpha
MIHFVMHDPKDSVGVVVVEDVHTGMSLNGWIIDEDQMTSVKATQDIPIGHKVALRAMVPGDTVMKYGVDIGMVTSPIPAGAHAHVHNIKTKRW